MTETNKIKVAVIGGGNGTAICLVALKKWCDRLDLSAIVSMSDSGGSSGKLRHEFGTLPPGDILRAVLALSRYDYSLLRQIFYEPRFEGLQKLDGHNLGNLFLVLTARYGGNFLAALEALSQSVDALGKVYPVTLDLADLAAELTSGEVIRTESFIDNPNYNRGSKIKKAWLEPEPKAYAGAEQALREADYIIISPGSLYTSLVAALLPKGIKESIATSKARLIYVAGSAYRLDGETGPEKLSDFVLQLEKYLPRQLDAVIYNNHILDEEQNKFYAEKKWGVFEKDMDKISGRELIAADFESARGGLSSEKLGEILKNILSA